MLAHGTKTIDTPRLILRKITMNDASDMFNNWASDPEVTRYLTWQPHASFDFTKKIISDWISHYRSDVYFLWAMELKETGQVIGTIGIVHLDETQKQGEIGYCMSQKYWNQGLMTEALQHILKYLSEETNFEAIYAMHDINNPASGKVMVKGGMKYIETKEKFSELLNTTRTLAVYRINLNHK